jgi:tetratricopeptide (TPR) repeat protein
MPRQHVAKDILFLFAQGKLAGADRRRVIRHLLLPCGSCRQALREVAVSAEAAVGPELQIPENLQSPASIGAERVRAETVWRMELQPLDSAQRLLLVRDDPRYYTWGFQELFLDQGKAMVFNDPFQALDLCCLSLEVVHRLPLDRYRRSDVADLRAGTLTAVANCKRLLGDLEGAQEAIDQALESLEWGTGDPLEEANVLSIYGSLLTDLGKIEEAVEILGAAAFEACEVGETQLQAKLVLQQASAIGWYEPERGLELTEQAVKLLTEGRSPHLDLVARYHLIFLRCELNQVCEARDLYELWAPKFHRQTNKAFWQGRILHLEAALTRQEGHFDVCESYLRQLLDHYAERGMQHDFALTTLDLAELLTVCRRYEEAQELIDGILPLFRQWKVRSDVLRAWLMIEEGIKGRTLETVSFREASRIIRRRWFHG